MKYLLLFLCGGIVGFLLHAFFFPDLFSNGVFTIPQITEQNSAQPAPVQNPLITTISFDGTFSRHNITIEQSRYLAIVNKNTQTLMWLSSNTPELSTQRGYGYMEQVKVRLDTKGQFVVADKNNPSEKLVVTVK